MSTASIPSDSTVGGHDSTVGGHDSTVGGHDSTVGGHDSTVGGHDLAAAQRRLRRAAMAALVTNIGIVVTGGAVRLTASGLGCPTFPRCTSESLVPTGELGVHGAIEFGNRLLTFVLVAVAVLVVVRAWRVHPARRDLRALSAGLLAGIPAQALIGGVTVLTGLNPWVVMLHFVCSMVLIALATVLVRRVDEPAGPAQPVVSRPVRALVGIVVTVAGLTAYLGTIVTGSGPHAGDRSAARTGLDVVLVTQLHADIALALVGLTVGLVVMTRAVGAPRRVVRAADVLLAVEAAQALIGYAQYFTGLPPVLVGAHMLGASLLVAAAVDTWLSTRVRTTAAPVGTGPIRRSPGPVAADQPSGR